MYTAVQIASRSLKRILVEADEAPMETTEYADFYLAMNIWMAELAADDLDLGYTDVSNDSDLVTIPDGAVNAVISNMAVLVAPEYEARVTPAIQRQADRGMEVITRLAEPKIETEYPPTLPIGSGNQGSISGIGYEYNFYGQQATGWLSINAPVTQTIPTGGARTRLTGPWDMQKLKALNGNITGVLRNVTSSIIDVTVELTMTVEGNTDYTFGIVNGSATELESSSTVTLTTGNTQLVTITGSMRLSPGEWISPYAANAGGSDDTLTIHEAEFKVV